MNALTATSPCPPARGRGCSGAAGRAPAEAGRLPAACVDASPGSLPPTPVAWGGGDRAAPRLKRPRFASSPGRSPRGDPVGAAALPDPSRFPACPSQGCPPALPSPARQGDRRVARPSRYL